MITGAFELTNLPRFGWIIAGQMVHHLRWYFTFTTRIICPWMPLRQMISKGLLSIKSKDLVSIHITVSRNTEWKSSILRTCPSGSYLSIHIYSTNNRKTSPIFAPHLSWSLHHQKTPSLFTALAVTSTNRLKNANLPQVRLHREIPRS